MKCLYKFCILISFVLLNNLVTAQSNVNISGEIFKFEKYFEKANSVVFYKNSIAFNADSLYTAPITSQGFFCITLHIEHPQEILLQYNGKMIILLINPGDSLKMKFDADNLEHSMVFSGRGGVENELINKYYHLKKQHDNNKGNVLLNRSQKDSTPSGFKKFIYKRYQADLLFYNQFLLQNNCTSIFKNWVKYNTVYKSANDLMNYTQYGRDTSLFQLKDYFDFFEKFPVENPEAIISSEYGAYLNRYYLFYLTNIKFRDVPNKYFSLIQKLTIFLSKKSLLSDEETRTVKFFMDNPQDLEFKRFSNQLFEKLITDSPELLESKVPISIDSMIDIFLKKGNLSDKEKIELLSFRVKVLQMNAVLYDEGMYIKRIVENNEEFWKGLRKPISQLEILKALLLNEDNLLLKEEHSIVEKTVNCMEINIILNKYSHLFNEVSFNPVIEYLFNDSSCISRDALLSNIMYNWIKNKEMLNPALYLERYQKEVKTDFIRKHLMNYYYAIEQKLSKYDMPENASLHSVPVSKGDSLFYKIIEPYKGKVIYIDFWATWCSPCRAEMPSSNKLKESFSDKDVIFIYLANRSREAIWKAVIAELGIKGEHFLLSDNDYNVLAEKFQITGIPHYILVNKNGKIADGNAKWPDNEELKNEINQILKL